MSDVFDTFPYVTKTRRVAGRNWLLTTVEDQDALLARVETEADLAAFPYGLLLWPAAAGLCEHLSENPDLVRGKRVLEIGAGIGLVGLVAQRLGPAHLLQTDYHPDALQAARQNARQNHAANLSILSIRHGDWRNWPDDLGDFDLVLGSDVLYERDLHPDLMRLLPRLIAPDGQIIFSDPLRPQAVSFVEQMEQDGRWDVQMDGRRVGWDGGTPEENQEKDIALWTFRHIKTQA